MCIKEFNYKTDVNMLCAEPKKAHYDNNKSRYTTTVVYNAKQNTQGGKKARPIRSSSYQVDSYTCD